jgi:cobalt-zinc-cadmium resistance protein CzcA
MIDRFIAFCLHKRHVAILVAFIVALLGYYSWTRLAIEAYPDISDVAERVTTQAPGLAAEEVEQQITIPLERALAGTPGLVSMRSSSTFGLSLISIVFRDGTEDYWIRQRIQERIANVSLPAGAQPGLGSVTTPTGEIYRYTLESDSKNLLELSEIQRWKVIPALNQVRGIAEVDNFGGFTKEYEIQLDPQQLQRFGLGLSDVTAAINNNSANAGGSRVTLGEQGYVIRGIGMVRTLNGLGDIFIKQSHGVPVFLRDLGHLRYGHQERQGILGKNNNPDTLEGIVLMLKHENASQVLKDVHAKVDELNRQLAAQDVHIAPYLDRDNLIQATVSNVSHTLLEGVGLVCIVLILFLGSPRSAMIVAVTIPLALAAVFILMNLLKMPANLFSLGAIDFGIIVDGAIVVTEAILRRREAKPTQELSPADVRAATQQVARPMIFATLIIITAYLPLFAFEHAEGKFVSPMAFTVGFALLGALLCTLALIPGLAYIAFRKPQRVLHNRPLEWLQLRYQRVLAQLLHRPVIASMVGIAGIIAVVFMGMTTGREFLPTLDEGALWLQVQLPSGVSLDKASEMASTLRRTLREFPEVSYAVTQLGRSDDGTDAWSPSHIEAPVGLTPYATWLKGETKEEFLRRLNARLQQLPGFSIGISQPISDMVDDAVGGTHSPLALRIYGDDPAELRGLAGRIVTALQHVEGTVDASIFQEPPIPQIVIDIDRTAIARYGINIADVTGLIQTGIGGEPVSQMYVADRVYNVTTRFSAETRNNPDKLGELILTSASGAHIPLSEVASIRRTMGESTISHEMGQRELTIRINFFGSAMSDYLAAAQASVRQAVSFDTTKYQLEWAGQFESLKRAQLRFVLVLALALSLMLIFLYAEFGKIRQALLILGIVPLATLGGLIALHITGETLNVATGVGFIALFGVAVQNGIILVANFNRVRDQASSLHEAVLIGAVERFRPVLMTATVATVGMLPAALATGVGTDVQRGVATVVVGGLIVATLLTLFILPAFYFVLERRVEKRAELKSSNTDGDRHDDIIA